MIEKNIYKYNQRVVPGNPEVGDLWWDGEKGSIFISDGVWVGYDTKKPYISDSVGKGYIFGGYKDNSTVIDDVKSMKFSHESIMVTESHLNSVYDTSVLSSKINAYSAGGFDSSDTPVTTIGKYRFASQTPTTNHSTLSTDSTVAATASYSYAGYIAGGYTTAPGSFLSTVLKLAFSSDTVTANINNLSVSTGYFSGLNSSIKGYFLQSYNNSMKISILNFQNESSSLNSIDAMYDANNTIGVNSSLNGYNIGGYAHNHYSIKNIRRFVFSNDDDIVNVSKLQHGRSRGTGFNSTVYGYVTGVYPEQKSFLNREIERFIFSADLADASVVAEIDASISYIDNSGFSTTNYNGYLFT